MPSATAKTKVPTPRHPLRDRTLRVQTVIEEESMTQQQFKAECDINQVLAKFQRTNVLDHINKHGARYGDATAFDYQEALNIKIAADQVFSELPSKIRNRFNNDPAEYLAFFEDPENREEGVLLGLLEPITAGIPTEDIGESPISENPEPARAPTPEGG